MHFKHHQFRREITREEAAEWIIRDVLLWWPDAKFSNLEFEETTWGSKPALDVSIEYESQMLDDGLSRAAETVANRLSRSG